MTHSLISMIKQQVENKGRGYCFAIESFADLGSYDAIRQSLARLNRIGFIKRLGKGIYCYPRHHDQLGELPVSIDAVIKLMQDTQKIRCQPSGAYAANLLDLSDQVPAKVVVLTDAQSKTITVDNQQIIFKQTTPKNMATAGTITGLIIQAIKYIGKEHITDQHLKKIKKRLTEKDINALKRDAHLAPIWVAELIKKKIIGD